MPSVRVGTSGWIYKHWRGAFYPPGLPQRRWLEFYAEHFHTVEVNFSFYRLPERSTFESWRRRAPPGFTYAVKGSRFITHLKQLHEPEEHVAPFFERVAGLGHAAGPILWQLPPRLRRDDARLDRFLAALPAGLQNAIEFRHESWLAEPVFELLAVHGVALCIPDHPRLPQALRLTTDWTYLRFHYGGGAARDGRDGNPDQTTDGDYRPEELARWAERISRFESEGVAVWAYFNNDWHGYAIRDALTLRGLLAPARPAPSGTPARGRRLQNLPPATGAPLGRQP